MRIQNEGTGKSSWWVINPDAKPGKAPRRRAGSMETKNLEKKRGRIKKRIDAIRQAQENGTLSSEDFQDFNYHNFQNLSPEFRTRAGSNASSCGRLSPIQAAVEPDLHESQVPPMSPIPWGQEMGPEDFNSNSNEGYSTIADSLLVGLNIADQVNQGLSNDSSDVDMLGNSTVKPSLLSGSNMMRYNSQNSFDTGYTSLPAPPPYSDHMQQQQNSQTSSVLNMDPSHSRTYTNMSPSPMYPENIMSPQRTMMPGPSSNNLGISTQHSPARSPQMSPNYSLQGYALSPQSVKRPQPTHQLANQVPSPVGVNPAQQQQQGPGRSLLQQCLEAPPPDSMLRAALTQQMNPTYQQQPQQVLATQPQQFSQYTNNVYNAPAQTLNLNNINNNQINNLPQSTMTEFAQQPQGETMPIRNESNMSLNEIDTNSMLDLDCDIEQLLRHELALDANLDFNFDGSAAQNGPTSENRNMVR